MAYQRKTTDEYEIQGNYGYNYGFECVTTEATRKPKNSLSVTVRMSQVFPFVS